MSVQCMCFLLCVANPREVRDSLLVSLAAWPRLRVLTLDSMVTMGCLDMCETLAKTGAPAFPAPERFPFCCNAYGIKDGMALAQVGALCLGSTNVAHGFNSRGGGEP
jgi:hypothetical protein